jgi:hypothetical protein
MFLDYLAFVILLIGLTLVFYTFVYIHDLPHAIAKKCEHPHEEAIHVACWLSLFTLHASGPLFYLWAVAHKKHAKGDIPVVFDYGEDVAALQLPVGPRPASQSTPSRSTHSRSCGRSSFA